MDDRFEVTYRAPGTKFQAQWGLWGVYRSRADADAAVERMMSGCRRVEARVRQISVQSDRVRQEMAIGA